MKSKSNEEVVTTKIIIPYQEGHPSCPVPTIRYDGSVDLHDHRTDEYGSYGSFSHCIMKPRGIPCRNTYTCDERDCNKARIYKKLGLKGVDYGRD